MGVGDLVAGDDHGHPLAREGLLLRPPEGAGDADEVAGEIVRQVDPVVDLVAGYDQGMAGRDGD